MAFILYPSRGTRRAAGNADNFILFMRRTCLKWHLFVKYRAGSIWTSSRQRWSRAHTHYKRFQFRGLATTPTVRIITDCYLLASSKEKRAWCRAILCRQCWQRNLGAQRTASRYEQLPLDFRLARPGEGLLKLYDCMMKWGRKDWQYQ